MTIQSDWITKWPNYCRACGGAGAIHWYEYHDRGYPGEPMSEPCSCMDHLLCPRCAAENPGWLDDNGDFGDRQVCSSCGWDSANPDCLPEVEDPDPEDFNLGEN